MIQLSETKLRYRMRSSIFSNLFPNAGAPFFDKFVGKRDDMTVVFFIELEMYKALYLKQSLSVYTNWGRDFVLNIKQNRQFADDVIQGKYTTKQLVKMNNSQMASKEIQQSRKERKQQNLNDSIIHQDKIALLLNPTASLLKKNSISSTQEQTCVNSPINLCTSC